MSMGNLPAVVSREEWLAARTELLAQEKALTRHRDEVNAARRRLPMVRIDNDLDADGNEHPRDTGCPFPWYSSYGSDFNYDFHATVDDRVAPVQIFGRGIEDFHNGYPHLDLTVLGRQEAWEEPEGRATPLGLHVGGPNMRLPDEYDRA